MQPLLSSPSDFSANIRAIPMAVALTFLLLYLMSVLIYHDFEEPKEVTEAPIKYPVYEEQEIDDIKDMKMPKKDKVETPPELPADVPVDPLTNVSIPQMKGTPSETDRQPKLWLEGMPVPRMQVAAEYPRGALQRGVEGYVDVRFDISALGTTENIVVTSANPEGVFERAALKAVKQWRYQPNFVDGVPQVIEGMSQRIIFRISQ